MLKTQSNRTGQPNVRAFKRAVLAYYKKEGRNHLPWRKTRDPYKILVSEVMLQQTQVERVWGYYKVFLERFPSVDALARAPLADVLKLWQGLGYNRRAKMLHQAAKEIVEKHGGTFPRSVEELQQLPGVGHYTASAVAAFAYNQDVVFVETNIRTAVIHHLFLSGAGVRPARSRIGRAARALRVGRTPAKRVSDKEVSEILGQALPKGKSREWYWALMDYGAYLKRSGVKLNDTSTHYTKQSKFAGSGRQARGAILKELAKSSATKARLLGLLGDDRTTQLESALAALLAEQLIEKRGNRFQLPR